MQRLVFGVDVLWRMALVLAALVLHGTAVLAQEDWTPPSITINPPGGIAASDLGISVGFTDSESSLVAESRYIKLNNVDITSQFSWESTYPSLGYANGTVTLQLGANSFEAYICDAWSNCRSESVTYTYDPATYSVVVTPDNAAAYPRASATRQQKFIVKNTSTASATFNFTAVCSGAAISGACTRSPTSLAIFSGATDTVTVTYSTTATVGNTGLVKLRAERNVDPAIKDSGWVNVTIGSQQTSVLDVNSVNAGLTVDRDLCLTIALGPGVASECGDLRLVHSLPSTRTYNKVRSPTLLYSSTHAHPYPLVAINSALPSGAAWPDSVVAVLSVGGQEKSRRRFAGEAWTPARASRIVLGFDTLAITTGIHTYQVKVINWYGGTQRADSLTGQFAAVNRKDSPFGAGWWLAGLEQLDPATMVVVGGDGSVRKYSSAGTGKWAAAPVDRPDTIYAVGSEFERRLPGGIVVRFDANGKHIRTTNRLGHITRFTYDGSARLDSIVLPSGAALRAYKFVYDGLGKLDSVIAPGAGSSRGVNVTVTSGTLTSIRDPDLSTMTYEYESGFANRVFRLTKPRGGTIAFYFDAGSKVTSAQTYVGAGQAYQNVSTSLRPLETRGMATVGNGNAVDTADAYALIDGPRSDVGDSTLFWLDKFGAPRKIRNAEGRETIVTRAHGTYPALVTKLKLPSGQVLTATYDARGNVASMVDSSTSSGGVYATTSYQWDSVWDFVTKIDPPMHDSVRFAYDATTGNRLWQRNAVGDTVHFRYYASGLIRAVDGPLTPPDSVDYDDQHNVLKVRTPKGFWTTYHRDALGRDTLVLSPNDSLQRYVTRQRTTYDVMDRPVVSKTWADSAQSPYNPSDSAIVSHFYNTDGQLDSLSRQAKPDRESIGVLTTRWRYDLAGRVVLETSPDLRKDSTVYDFAGNVIRTKTRRGHELTMEYDALGRLVRRIVPQVDYAQWGDAAMGNFPLFPNNGTGYRIPADTASFAFDSAGNLVTANNGDARVTRIYNASGTLRSEELKIRTLQGNDFTQHVTTVEYGYDLNGRRTFLKHPARLAPATGKDTTRYEYDAAGRLSAVRDPYSQFYRTYYDAEGRIDSVVGPWRTRLRNHYDEDSRVVRRDDAGAKWVSGNSFVTAIIHADTFQYDARNRATRVRTAADTISIGYHPLGPLTSVNAWNRTSSLYWFSDAWGYDALGNIRSRGSAGVSGDDTTGSSEDYSYFSGSGRINETIRVEWGPVGYVNVPVGYADYDSSGNQIRSRRAEPVPGASDAVHRRVWYYAASQQLRASDTRACTLSSETANPPFTCLDQAPADTLWDWYPYHFELYYYQLPVKPEGTFEEYRYDALGRRVWVRSRQPSSVCRPSNECVSVVERTVWDGQQRLYDIRYPGGDADSLNWERDTGAVVISGQPQPHNGQYGRVAYIHGGAVDLPVAIIRMDYRKDIGGGQIKYASPFTSVVHTNWRGEIDYTTLDSTTAVASQTDGVSPAGFEPSNGVAGMSEGYNPRLLPWNGSLLFNQQDRSGLTYRRNRYVDPLTGRFTQEDPLGLVGGINLYGFAAGDAVNFDDPFGLCPGMAGTNQWDLSDCPPGYFSLLLGTIGGAGGGLAGALAGAVGCSPSGGGALFCAVGGGIAGARAGTLIGGFVGSALDAGIWLANNTSGRGGDDPLSAWARANRLNPSSPTTQNLFTNRGMKVTDFIAKFRKASIREVFPSEYLHMTVEEALRAGGSIVRKLLVSIRYVK